MRTHVRIMSSRRPRESERETFQRLDCRWQQLGDIGGASREAMDAAGFLLIRHVLGLSEKTAIGFQRGSLHARHLVGMRQGCPGLRRTDLRRFWREVAKLFPRLLTKHDLAYL
ncbi:MAG: hypothetical protein HY566_03480, partial [Candidatus Kerfeldbacteria bacterium]|nr:hypothetical protein [Candidatus Kerfeldbacteria bacterium]